MASSLSTSTHNTTLFDLAQVISAMRFFGLHVIDALYFPGVLKTSFHPLRDLAIARRFALCCSLRYRCSPRPRILDFFFREDPRRDREDCCLSPCFLPFFRHGFGLVFATDIEFPRYSMDRVDRLRQRLSCENSAINQSPTRMNVFALLPRDSRYSTSKFRLDSN